MMSAPEPVSFIEAGERSDPYSGGTVKDDWANPVTVLTDAAGVEPIGSEEPQQDGRQSVIVGYRLYFDHAVTMNRLWRCVVRGETLEVVGRPALWRNPFTGWEAGTVVEVRWVDG